MGKGFCRNLVLQLVSIIPLTFHIHLKILNQKDKRVKNRKFHTVQVLSHISDHWTEKGVHTFLLTFKTTIFPAFLTEKLPRLARSVLCLGYGAGQPQIEVSERQILHPTAPRPALQSIQPRT